MKVKVEARENIILRSIRKRLESGDSVILEDPSDSTMDILEKQKSRGNIRYTILEEETIITVDEEEAKEEVEEEEDKEEVEEEVDEDNVESLYEEETVDEYVEENERFDCTICGKTHYTDSNIGKEHLKEMLEDEN